MLQPYDIVAELEAQIAEYSGANYAVAVDSCSNALLLAMKYRVDNGYLPVALLPKYTYVGVAQAALNAGCTLCFRDEDWQGAYEIGGLAIVDSARRFRRDMHKEWPSGYLYCLSCHWWKHLKLGRGGFILTDDLDAAQTLRRMRYDGRYAGVAPKDDAFIRGYHCYMLPEEAARGLMLMKDMKDDNPDIPWDGYADLSRVAIFGGK